MISVCRSPASAWPEPAFLWPTQMLPVTSDDSDHLMGRYYTCVTGESVNRPERQCYLMCFVTSSSCLGRHLHLCICLGGGGFGSVRLHLLWLLSACQLLLMTCETSQANAAWTAQPCESKLSVSRCRTLKLWPDCWTELRCSPLQYVGVRVHRVHSFIPFLSAIGSAAEFSRHLEKWKKKSSRFPQLSTWAVLWSILSKEFCGDLQMTLQSD